MSRIACQLFVIASDSCLSISLTFHYAFAITCTFMDCCTSTCTFLNCYIFTLTTFSCPMSFYTICFSTKCCSIASSSFNSSMNIESTNVAPSLICSLTCQLLLLLCKTQLHMFQFYIYHELSFAQIASSHYMFFLLHVSKMMMNAAMTLQPTVEYSTHLHDCTFQPFFCFCSSQQFSFLLLPSSMFTPLHFLFLCYSLQFLNRILCIHALVNSITSNVHNSQQQTQIAFNGQPVFFRL